MYVSLSPGSRSRGPNMTERRDQPGGNESSEREIYESIFEHVCTQASERFKERGAHEPLLLVLTRLGIALIPIDMVEGAEREPIARAIRENIVRTAVKVDNEKIFDEPQAVILASEAWMVEYDPSERVTTSQLPPRPSSEAQGNPAGHTPHERTFIQP